MTFAEYPSPLNPLGVKGVGESGCVPAAGAIVSAIENALSPFGVRIDEYPVTPARLFALLKGEALGFRACANSFIGSPVERLEDLRFLRGRGQYVDDVPSADALHAAILRSPVAHGRIRSIDTSAALKRPACMR